MPAPWDRNRAPDVEVKLLSGALFIILFQLFIEIGLIIVRS